MTALIQRVDQEVYARTKTSYRGSFLKKRADEDNDFKMSWKKLSVLDPIHEMSYACNMV
jgi:DDE superfamily endonuclease.